MATQASDVAPYWDSEPVAQYDHGTRHADGIAAQEVAVYDDDGTYKVQFRTNGPVRRSGDRRRRVAVFSFDSGEGFAEFLDGLSDLLGELV